MVGPLLIVPGTNLTFPTTFWKTDSLNDTLSSPVTGSNVDPVLHQNRAFLLKTEETYPHMRTI